MNEFARGAAPPAALAAAPPPPYLPSPFAEGSVLAGDLRPPPQVDFKGVIR